jgi:hypothetical protein
MSPDARTSRTSKLEVISLVSSICFKACAKSARPKIGAFPALRKDDVFRHQGQYPSDIPG